MIKSEHIGCIKSKTNEGCASRYRIILICNTENDKAILIRHSFITNNETVIKSIEHNSIEGRIVRHTIWGTYIIREISFKLKTLKYINNIIKYFTTHNESLNIVDYE